MIKGKQGYSAKSKGKQGYCAKSKGKPGCCAKSKGKLGEGHQGQAKGWLQKKNTQLQRKLQS
jgi:hypothetical protein